MWVNGLLVVRGEEMFPVQGDVWLPELVRQRRYSGEDAFGQAHGRDVCGDRACGHKRTIADAYPGQDHSPGSETDVVLDIRSLGRL